MRVQWFVLHGLRHDKVCLDCPRRPRLCSSLAAPAMVCPRQPWFARVEPHG